MLEQQRAVAINQVILACREAERRYETAAEIIGDKRLKKTFQDYARARKKSARRLEEELKDTGSLPLAPDPEKALLESLWTRVKAAVKNDEYTVLFQESLNLETEIINRSDDVLKHAVPGSIFISASSPDVCPSVFRRIHP